MNDGSCWLFSRYWLLPPMTGRVKSLLPKLFTSHCHDQLRRYATSLAVGIFIHGFGMVGVDPTRHTVGITLLFNCWLWLSQPLSTINQLARHWLANIDP